MRYLIAVCLFAVSPLAASEMKDLKREIRHLRQYIAMLEEEITMIHMAMISQYYEQHPEESEQVDSCAEELSEDKV